MKKTTAADGNTTKGERSYCCWLAATIYAQRARRYLSNPYLVSNAVDDSKADNIVYNDKI